MTQALAVNELIGARVRQHRAARGWTLDELADRSGVSRRMVITIEHGDGNPSIATLLRISDALGVGLPVLVDVERPQTTTVTAAGQARVLWDSTPVDLFFAYDPFHHAAGRALRTVPFAETSIPILAPEHLVVCKVVFNRAKDWVDIDAIVAAETPVDVAEVLRWVGRIAGDDDPRFERIVSVLTRR